MVLKPVGTQNTIKKRYNMDTGIVENELMVPKLKGVPFETAVIERYCCREFSVEEALIEMYLTGISVRGIGDISGKQELQKTYELGKSI